MKIDKFNEHIENLASDVKKVGEFKYIFGLEIDKTVYPDLFK